MPLFERGPLQQETGVLAPRWNQDGSEVKTANGSTSGAGVTFLTVSAGKTYYLQTLVFSVNGTTGGYVTWKDGGSGGTTKFTTYGRNPDSQYTTHTLNFDPPVPFETDVWAIAVTHDQICTLTGWEE